jgi:hypothetical protein
VRQDPAAEIRLNLSHHERGQLGRLRGELQFAEKCQPVILQHLVQQGFFWTVALVRTPNQAANVVRVQGTGLAGQWMELGRGRR